MPPPVLGCRVLPITDFRGPGWDWPTPWCYPCSYGRTRSLQGQPKACSGPRTGAIPGPGSNPGSGRKSGFFALLLESRTCSQEFPGMAYGYERCRIRTHPWPSGLTRQPRVGRAPGQDRERPSVPARESAFRHTRMGRVRLGFTISRVRRSSKPGLPLRPGDPGLLFRFIGRV